MKFRFELICVSILCILSSFAFGEAEENASAQVDSDVLDLSASNFTEIVNPEKLILVEFYATWCGHCKALAPEYEIAAKTLKELNIKLAKVECTVEAELCQKHDVSGYPTLKVFREGEPKDYTGPRVADGIVSYMRKQSLPALSEVTAENIETFKDSDNKVIIGFFSSKDTEEFKNFDAIANNLRDDYLFGATIDSDIAKKFDVKVPGIILFKKFDEGKDVYEGKITEKEVSEFIKINSVPLVDEISPENYSTYASSGIPVGFLFVENDEQRKTFGEALRPVAKQFKGKVAIAFIDSTKYGTHAENINLKQKWPAFGIQNLENMTKYPFDQSKEINAENIQDFLEKFVKGEIKPSLKSEPVPESNTGNVTVIVGTEYEKLVLTDDKDVLVEYYAPWCGHCQNLAPIYEELGKLYSPYPNIVISKMDATENDLPSDSPFQVSGFPTIKLFKAGKSGKEKEIADYEGDRTLQSLVDFLKTNAVNKAEVVIEEVKEEEKKEDKKEEDPLHDEL